MRVLEVVGALALFWAVTMALGLIFAPDVEPWSRAWSWLGRLLRR